MRTSEVQHERSLKVPGARPRLIIIVIKSSKNSTCPQVSTFFRPYPKPKRPCSKHGIPTKTIEYIIHYLSTDKLVKTRTFERATLPVSAGLHLPSLFRSIIAATERISISGPVEWAVPFQHLHQLRPLIIKRIPPVSR